MTPARNTNRRESKPNGSPDSVQTTLGDPVDSTETGKQPSILSNRVKRLILTADDFGVSRPVNEAIEQAHRQGCLTCASLMMGAEATSDAIERARRTSSLKIGLHLVLADGSSILPSYEIPDLVNQAGKFPSHFFRPGFNFYFSPRAKRQLAAEILAQFEVFRRTGLPLDHVTTHHHMHLHPTISALILKEGREYGLRAMRLPYESPLASWRASGNGILRRTSAWLLLSPWISLLRKRLRQTRVRSNDFLFGMYDSGHLSHGLMLRFLKFLPSGIGEIYFHPGSNTGDFQALTHPAVREALVESRIQTISFSDLVKLKDTEGNDLNRPGRGNA